MCDVGIYIIQQIINYTQHILKYPDIKIDSRRLTFPELVQSFIHVDEDVGCSVVVLISY